MPTVPSVQVSSVSDVPSVSSVAASSSPNDSGMSGYAVAGPTPDPETDDVVLVAGESCGPVGSAGRDLEGNEESMSTSQMVRRPRRLPSLSGLVLHSPTSIVGTPLDPTTRFEYPFPPNESTSPDMDAYYSPPLVYSPSLSPGPSQARFFNFPVPAAPLLTPTLTTAVFTTNQPTLSLPPFHFSSLPSRGSKKQPQHPRLSPKPTEPPIPPRLAQKCALRGRKEEGSRSRSSSASTTRDAEGASSPQNNNSTDSLVSDQHEKWRRQSLPVIR
ncbi:hypothetical protein OE88DRAFT_1809163 [Heliocybe sulcata]|uniref:Uncharacterized protein n=1 Tax=Heliocybe sulcata TaxID=5364 RepID=A0A5C3MY89_9AGAM|nr:hypothetical protein OE88DRAFT_1809163 [Heliocybe sulcata]